jgi:hypothetical protein
MKNLTEKIIIIGGIFGLSIGIGVGIAVNSRPPQVAKIINPQTVETPKDECDSECQEFRQDMKERDVEIQKVISNLREIIHIDCYIRCKDSDYYDKRRKEDIAEVNDRYKNKWGHRYHVYILEQSRKKL